MTDQVPEPVPDPEEKRGVIKRKVDDRGYAFIYVDKQDPDFFMHHTDLVNCEWETLSEGDEVRFIPQPDYPKGPRASNVHRVRENVRHLNYGEAEER